MRWWTAAVTVTMLACGSPTTPTPLTPSERSDFSGVWQGEYQVTDCTGSRQCFAARGTARAFVLRLSQTGRSAAGVLTVGGVVSAPTVGGVSIDVTGTIGPDGLLTLTGARPSASAFDGSGDIEVTRFTLQRDLQRGLTGTLEYVVRYTLQQNPEAASILWAGSVTTARRGVEQQPLSFAGHWVGSYVVRRCLAVGWTLCLPEQADHVYSFNLRLTQTGQALTGTMAMSPPATAMAVTGVVSVNSLTVDGMATGVQSGVDADVLRLTRWSTTRDEIGRLLGSFSFVRETHWASTAHGGEVWTINYDAELVGVVLQP